MGRTHIAGWMLGVSVLAALAACTSHYGQQFSVSNASQIRSGVSTKADVEQALGEPYQRNTAANGDETWTYVYNSTTVVPGATAFIPFIGPMLPNSTNASADNRQVVIAFHGDLVSSCHLRVATSKTTGQFAMGGGVVAGTQAEGEAGTGSSRETDCGDSAQ